MKICINCKKSKSLKEFPWKNKKKGRLNARCKQCVSKYQKDYYNSNRKKLLLQCKEYRSLNIEEIKQKKYWKKRSVERNIISREWALNNPERTKAITNASDHRRRTKLINHIEISATTDEIFDLKKNSTNCFICGCEFDENKHKKSLEHIIPVGVGGSNSLYNLRITGLSCNLARPKDGIDLSLLIA